VVYAGYADCPSLSTCGANTATNPSFPTPWYTKKTAKKYQFVGTEYNLATDTDPDTSAIRIDNTGTSSITVNDVSVPTCGSLDLWGTSPFAYPYVVKAGGNIVFTSTVGDNFDGSDICGSAGDVSVVVNGVTGTYADDIANSGGGAIHGGSAGSYFGDESTPWTKLAGNAVTIALVPTKKLAKGVVGTSYDAIIGAQGSNGDPTFSVKSGSLPPGLSLVPDSDYTAAVDLTGTPTKAGTYSFTLGVTDSATPQDTGAQKYKIKVSS
jgi:hypothetical protein